MGSFVSFRGAGAAGAGAAGAGAPAGAGAAGAGGAGAPPTWSVDELAPDISTIAKMAMD